MLTADMKKKNRFSLKKLWFNAVVLIGLGLCLRWIFPSPILQQPASRSTLEHESSLVVINDQRPRLTVPTPILEKIVDPSLYPQAQTIHHLVRQMAETGRYTAKEISQVMKAHRLGIALTGSSYRGQGRPLDAHLIGTASLAVTYGQPVQVIMIMITHSLNMFARVKRENTWIKPELLDVEEMLRSCGAGYSDEAIDILLHWRQDKQHSGDNVDPHLFKTSSLAADMVVLEALNDLDELLDLYLVGFKLKKRRQISNENLKLVGANTLAQAIEAARQQLVEVYDRHPEIWRAAALNDVIPGEIATWSIFDANIPIGNGTDLPAPKRKRTYATGATRWQHEVLQK